MAAREAIARVLMDLPAGVVRWASAPAERLPRVPTGVPALDAALDGGWPRGRVCTLHSWGAGATWSRGRTACAGATVAVATARGRLAAWVDGDGSLDPASLAAAGADLDRVLWVCGPLEPAAVLSAAEEVLKTGGFEVVVLRGGGGIRGPDPWVRLARTAERARVPVLALDGGDVPGAVTVRLGRLVPAWDGTPGISTVLLGARVALEADAGDVQVSVPTADAAPWGAPLPPASPREAPSPPREAPSPPREAPSPPREAPWSAQALPAPSSDALQLDSRLTTRVSRLHGALP